MASCRRRAGASTARIRRAQQLHLGCAPGGSRAENGLTTLVVGPRLPPLEPRFLTGARRQHQHRQIAQALVAAQGSRLRRRCRGLRHHHVGDHQVGRCAPGSPRARGGPSPTASKTCQRSPSRRCTDTRACRRCRRPATMGGDGSVTIGIGRRRAPSQPAWTSWLRAEPALRFSRPNTPACSIAEALPAGGPIRSGRDRDVRGRPGSRR